MRSKTAEKPPVAASADTEKGRRQLSQDLEFVFSEKWFSLRELKHFRANFHRLVRHTFRDEENRRCMFGLLTELRDHPVESREALTRLFTGGSGDRFCERPEYQPARWLVRLFDAQICDQVSARYRGVPLDYQTLLMALEKAIDSRTMIEQDRRVAVGVLCGLSSAF